MGTQATFLARNSADLYIHRLLSTSYYVVGLVPSATVIIPASVITTVSSSTVVIAVASTACDKKTATEEKGQKVRRE